MSFYGVVLEGGCRLEIDQHEPQILRAGDFMLIPAAYRFALTSLFPAAFTGAGDHPVKLAAEHFRPGALDQPAEMQALIGHCAADSDNASLLTSLLPALVVVRDQPRLATFVGLLKEEARADRAGKSFVLARMVELCLSRPSDPAERSPPRTDARPERPGSPSFNSAWHQAPARRWTVNWPPTARCLARRYLNALPA